MAFMHLMPRILKKVAGADSPQFSGNLSAAKHAGKALKLKAFLLSGMINC